MKIVHMSDIHLTEAGVTLNGLDTYDRFRRALTHVWDDHADAARIVISGDLTHWADPAAYQRLKTAIADSPVPIRLLIGNHDARAPFRAAFPDHPCDPNGYINYAETLRQTRLIYLDTIEPLTHAGHFCTQRRGWLDAELATLAPTQDALLFCHHNPLDLGAPAEDLIALNPKDQAALRDILRRHRTRIRLIAFGHVHTPLCGTMEGIPFSGTPSTAVQGIPDLAPGDQLKGALMEPSYRVILRRGVDTVVHQIPFAWDGPVTTSGTGWQDWAKPEA